MLAVMPCLTQAAAEAANERTGAVPIKKNNKSGVSTMSLHTVVMRSLGDTSQIGILKSQDDSRSSYGGAIHGGSFFNGTAVRQRRNVGQVRLQTVGG